jgi:hypothetical protein
MPKARGLKLKHSLAALIKLYSHKQNGFGLVYLEDMVFLEILTNIDLDLPEGRGMNQIIRIS